MTIWKKKFTLEEINAHITKSGMMKLLEMICIDQTPDSLTMQMEVDDKAKQTHGILHGGASAALAETVGSVASYLTIEDEKSHSVGLELTISHLKMVREGLIRATAKPIKLGSTIQVWEIRTVNPNGDLIAFSRLTTMILKDKA